MSTTNDCKNKGCVRTYNFGIQTIILLNSDKKIGFTKHLFATKPLY